MSVRHYQLPWADHLDLHLGVSGGGVGAAQVCTRPSYMSVCAGRGVRSVPNTAEMDGGQWRSRAWWWRIWQAWLHSPCLGQNQLPLQAIHQNVARSQIFLFFREREAVFPYKKIVVCTARAFFAYKSLKFGKVGCKTFPQDNVPILESGVNVGNAVESRQSPSVSRQISLLFVRCICQYMLSGIIIFIVQGSCPSLNKSDFFCFSIRRHSCGHLM